MRHNLGLKWGALECLGRDVWEKKVFRKRCWATLHGHGGKRFHGGIFDGGPHRCLSHRIELVGVSLAPDIKNCLSSHFSSSCKGFFPYTLEYGETFLTSQVTPSYFKLFFQLNAKDKPLGQMLTLLSEVNLKVEVILFRP